MLKGPILDVLKETAKYSRNIAPVDSVTIKIKNVAPNPEGKNIIAQLKHYISMPYHNWRSTEARVDGSTYDSKTQLYHSDKSYYYIKIFEEVIAGWHKEQLLYVTVSLSE